MQTFTANDAKQYLGRVIDTALQEPVSITRHGRSVVVVISDREYQEYFQLKYQNLKDAVTAGFQQLDRGEHSRFTADEIAERVLQRHSQEED